MEASIGNLGSNSGSSPVDVKNPELTPSVIAPGFTATEVVTTSNGTIVRGAFGEVSEKMTLENGVMIEGAFYE